MLERAVKFLFKIFILIFTLFGVRYLLAIIGVVIPLEWFLIMIAGMLGFYGIIIVIMYALFINLL